MGLFDSLKKTAVNKIVNTVEKSVGKTIDGAVGRKIDNAAGSLFNSKSSHANTSGNSSQSAGPAAHQNNAAANTENLDQKFDQILAAEFSDLKVVRNASPESVGITASGPSRPYTYALLRNGKTVAAIMLTPHNRDKNSAFLNAKKSALNSNVKFLNFYTHFSNERSYVVSRIKSAL